MEIGLREWLIIGGAVVVLLIILDGWRRMKGARSRLRMDIEPQPTELPEETDSYNPELPNGGARLVGDVRADALDTVSSGAKAEASPEPELTKAESLDTEAAITETVEVKADVDTGEGHDVRTEPTFELPISEERIEPVLDVSSLSDIEKEVVSDTSNDVDEQRVEPVAQEGITSDVEPAIDQGKTLASEIRDEDAATEYMTPENLPAEESTQTTVVEEEIMTSAALFEAIEQSRQLRSAAAIEQTLEDDGVLESTTEERDAEHTDYAESLSESAETEAVEPQAVSTGRKPDPLLRPLPELEPETLAEPSRMDGQDDLITVAETPLTDDPLLDGIEDEQESQDEIDALNGLAAEPQLSPAAELNLPAAESEPEPQFIQDLQSEIEPEWASRVTAEVTQPSISDETPEPELDLPPEFALPVDNLAQSIDEKSSLAAMALNERDETVVAFPEKKTRAKEPDISQAEAADTVTSNDSDDVKVKAGSLRQQPDPANVLVMTVIANQADGFNGEVLMKLVLACGMRFGEMDIFHRFEDGIDTGAVQFSMANATGSGTFNVGNMADLQTRAVSFFMSMEEPREVMNAFECMLATAETLARHLDGELVDENRIVMRPQTQEHYRQRVRDFEMRNLRRRSG